MMPARKSCPMDCSVIMPNMMSVTEGGMRTPEGTYRGHNPGESRLSYLKLSISGIATLANVAEWRPKSRKSP